MVGTAQARLCPPYQARGVGSVDVFVFMMNFPCSRNGARNNAAAAKRLLERRIWPRPRLVCAVWRVNDATTKPLETKPSVVHYAGGGRIGLVVGPGGQK